MPLTLVTEILLREDRRLSITVNDGEEDTLIRSRDIGQVLERMATTDWDFLKVFEQQADGELDAVRLFLVDLWQRRL